MSKLGVHLIRFIFGHKVKFLVDSGASVNIVSFNESRALGVVLQPCDTRVCAFNSCDPLLVMGRFSALVESKCSAVNAEFLVVESQTTLLGYATVTELGILWIANVISVERNIFQRYPSLFGKMKNVAVKLHIDKSVNPVHQPHRRIPFHQRKSLEACVESLLKEDLLSLLLDQPPGSLQLFWSPSQSNLVVFDCV
ncbi:uncharacterized protein [Montipora capricornis]|uniref:uncharacterized protein n=1 Tax=Montipora capricornis TaxID=246305 RepID=UPI0035F0FE57